MRSTTGVLVFIKVFQLIGSAVCLGLHIQGFTTGLNLPHITVFCGTYMGFTLVNMAFLVSAGLGKPAAEELDMAFGVIGSVLFYICGVLGMYFVREDQIKAQKATGALVLPEAIDINPLFFKIAQAQAIVSLMTALVFVFDLCLKFDMWKYDLDLRRNRLDEDSFDPPALRLCCVDPCFRCYERRKLRKERTMMQKNLSSDDRVHSFPTIVLDDDAEKRHGVHESPKSSVDDETPQKNVVPTFDVEEPEPSSEESDTEYGDAPWLRFLRTPEERKKKRKSSVHFDEDTSPSTAKEPKEPALNNEPVGAPRILITEDAAQPPPSTSQKDQEQSGVTVETPRRASASKPVPGPESEFEPGSKPDPELGPSSAPKSAPPPGRTPVPESAPQPGPSPAPGPSSARESAPPPGPTPATKSAPPPGHLPAPRPDAAPGPAHGPAFTLTPARAPELPSGSAPRTTPETASGLAPGPTPVPTPGPAPGRSPRPASMETKPERSTVPATPDPSARRDASSFPTPIDDKYSMSSWETTTTDSESTSDDSSSESYV